jgi:hypothetical protein
MGKWENEQVNKHGFYIHYVPENQNTVNIHTHGVSATYNHSDFQIVLPLQKEVAATILQDVISLVKEGSSFEKEGVYNNILDNCPVYLKKTVEGGRKIMRLIFPDSKGQFQENSSSDTIYSSQWKALS